MDHSLFRVLLLVTLLVSCLAQTFQYSRGWINGKRGLVTHEHRNQMRNHRLLNEDNQLNQYNYNDMVPVSTADFLKTLNEHTNGELNRKAARCLLQIQQILRNPTPLQTPFYNNLDNYLAHHQENPQIDEVYNEKDGNNQWDDNNNNENNNDNQNDYNNTNKGLKIFHRLSN